MLMSAQMVLSLVLGAANPAVEVRTLELRPMAPDAGKAVGEQRLGTPKALHRMHAHIAPDGRTVIGCQLSHRDLPDLRQLRDGQVRP